MDIGVTLLSSIVETRERFANGTWVASFNPAGEPHAAAVVDAVVGEYERVTDRASPSRADLAAAADLGLRVSLAYFATRPFGARSVLALEGRLTTGPADPAQDRGGRAVTAKTEVLLLRPKGSRRRTIRLEADRVLDLEAGLRRTDVLRRRIAQTRAALPPVEPLTRQHLLELPQDAGDDALIGLAAFGTCQLPDGPSPAAIWLLHSYQPQDDITEGYLLVRDGQCEHGSIYGRHLLEFGGRIAWTSRPTSAQTPALTLAGAFDLGALPTHEQRLAAITELTS